MRPPMTESIMKFFLAVICVVVLSSPVYAGIPTDVVVNKSTLLNLQKPAERVSVTNPAIADILLISPRQIQVNGIAAGTTSLVVWERGGTSPLFFDISVKGDVSMLEAHLKEVAPGDELNATMVKDTIILSGKANSQHAVDKAVQIAKAHAPTVLNHISIDKPQQVLLQVKVAHVDRTALKNLGVSYVVKGTTAEGYSGVAGVPKGGISGSGGSTSATGTNNTGLGSFDPLSAFTLGVSYFPSGIGAVIQALASKNLAKILAEPNMLVKSGQKGNFLAGSKIPYNVVTSTGGTATTSVVFVDVGVKLNFTPDVLSNGMIALKIDPAEVSSIAGKLEVNGYPIIDTREVRTSVELRDGESLVLAGLLQEETIRTMSKVPLFGDIPILGALFRATSDELKEKELVFFVTPKIVKPLPPGEKVELPTDKKLTPEQEREMQWIPLPK